MPDKKDSTAPTITEERMCFVVMPITDPDGYVKGHFKHVYEDIVQPSCIKAGFKPFRADEVKQSNLIHLDILQKLLEAPMAVCDLSNRNPNVLFELALRQAFDKPVTLVQEVGTPQIFDISPLRYTEYRKERIYHEVLEDQKSITSAIEETFKSHGTGRSINSIVKLLALSKPATLPVIGSPEAKADLQQLILAELSQLRSEIRSVRQETQVFARRTLRRDLNPELDRLRELTMRTEMLLASDDESSVETAEHAIAECRNRFMRMVHEGSREESKPITPRDHEMLMDMDRRIDMLEMALHKRRSTSAKKKQ